MKECAAPDCSATPRTRGLCIKHYTQMLRHGAFIVKKTPNGEAMSWLMDSLTFDGAACLIWPYARGAHGYGIVRYDERSQIASRVICRLKHGEPPSCRYEAAHSCGRGGDGCVNPNHIRWATPQENNQDKISHGTSRRGEKSPVHKLTETDVRQIRRLLGQVSQRKLASRFGVSQGCIAEISERKNWAWLE